MVAASVAPAARRHSGIEQVHWIAEGREEFDIYVAVGVGTATGRFGAQLSQKCDFDSANAAKVRLSDLSWTCVRVTHLSCACVFSFL